MRTNWIQTGRRITPLFYRRPSGSSLLHLILLFSLLIPLPACLFPSCRKIDDGSGLDLVELQPDSCKICLHFSMDNRICDTLQSAGSLDVLVYQEEGLKPLRDKRHYDFMPDSIIIYGPKEGLVAVALANYPLELFSCPPQRFEEAEALVCEFDSDSPSHPLMSACRILEPGESGSLKLVPLMSKVKLGEIRNNQKDYIRLEDPRVFLENANFGAEILRDGGFRPSELLRTPSVRLPYDIGVFAQWPGTELFCYPNDSPEATIGTPSTVLVFECEIKNQTRQFRVPLPSVRRNTVMYVDISVDGPDAFESKVY